MPKRRAARSSSRTRRSGARRASTSSSPGCGGSSWRAPVAIDAAQTGVTDGNAAHAVVDVGAALDDRLAAPGARPVSIARSSIAGFMPSMTARTSLAGPLRRMRRPAYFSPARRRPPAQQPGEEADGDDRQRRHEDRQRGERPARRPRRRAAARLRPGASRRARTRAKRSRVGDGWPSAAHSDAGEQARPPRLWRGRRASPANSSAAEADAMPPARRSAGPGSRRARARATITTSATAEPASQEPRRLEEREVGAVEVDADVGRGERAGDQRGQERPDAGGGGEAEALEDVEEERHVGTVARA